MSAPVKYALVPVYEMERIEQSRRLIYKMFEDYSRDAHFQVRLGQATGPLWDVANRKWETITK